MNSAPEPAANGDPETGVRPPEELTAKAETVPEPRLLTKAKAVVVAGVFIIEFVLIMPHPWRSDRMRAKDKKMKAGISCRVRRKLAGWCRSVIVRSPITSDSA